jgi:hypothetical protein
LKALQTGFETGSSIHAAEQKASGPRNSGVFSGDRRRPRREARISCTSRAEGHCHQHDGSSELSTIRGIIQVHFQYNGGLHDTSLALGS